MSHAPGGGTTHTIGKPHFDDAGVAHYPVQSIYQRSRNADGSPAYTDLRVIEPDKGVGGTTRLLYVLPVQPGTPRSMAGQWATDYGDGIAAMRDLDVANRCDLVVVEPDFNAVEAPGLYETGPAPWYGDSPASAAIRQESYIVSAVVPAVDSLYPAARRERLLLGYSKSGWGAINLLLRHPDLFEAAAAWDAPLMMRSISPPHYADEDIVFGRDNDYFTREYRLDTHLSAAGALKGRNRIWLGINPATPIPPPGRRYAGDFPRQTEDFAAALDVAGIPYTLRRQSGPRKHSWGPTSVGGRDVYWEVDAIEFLAKR